MISKLLKKFSIMSVIAVMSVTFFGMSNMALAQTGTAVPSTSTGSVFSTPDDDIVGTGQKDGRTWVKDILKYFLGFLGLLCVIMIIYGGFLYITSAGEEEGAKKGKTIILYCVIGLLIIAASFVIVDTVLKGITTVGS